MKKSTEIIIYGIIIVLIVMLTVFFYPTRQTQPQIQQNQTQNNQTQVIKNQTQIILNNTISQVQLATHHTQSDCWIGYKGKVYDITAWLPQHPGSAGAIAPYCGNSTKFEEAFQDQHGSSQINKLLEEGIYKGDLK